MGSWLLGGGNIGANISSISSSIWESRFLFFALRILRLICFLMRGAILHARISRKVIRKMMIPAVQSPIIFKVSNQENMDPIVLSCSAVTTISDSAFDSVSWSRPTKSFKIFNCFISITLWAGWAFNAKSKSLSFSSSNSAIKSIWVV